MIRNLNVIWCWLLLTQVGLSQDYQFRIKHVVFDELEQEVELGLRTNDFEALNFFNQSQEDFTVRFVDPVSRIPLECEVVDLHSEQLSKSGVREWHIVIDVKDMGNIEASQRIKRIYQGIRKANLAQNAFVNVHLLGDELKTISSDFVKLPKFTSVARLANSVGSTSTNFVQLANIFADNRRHLIVLITDGSVGDQIRTQDRVKVEELFIEKLRDYKEDVEIYPILYTADGDLTILKQAVELTSSADDEIEVNGIRKVARQKDGTFSRRKEFDFTIVAKPQLLKGQYYALFNDPINLICQYDNQKSDRTYSVQTSVIPTTAIRPLAFFGLGGGSGWFSIGLGMGLIVLLLLALYLVVPIYNRYTFKKNHVFKYQDIKQAKRTRKDPLTLEEFHCDNDIVVFGEKMMLLDTWKYMRSRDDIETAKDYSEFFQENVEGSILSHSDGTFYWSYLAFFAAIAALLVYVITQAALFLIDQASVEQMIGSVGLRIISDHLMIWITFVATTLLGLGVFYFQNKLSDHAYWRRLSMLIPLVVGLVAAPLLVILVSDVVEGSLGSHLRDVAWSIGLASTLALTMRRYGPKQSINYLASIIIGAIVYYILLRLFGISSITATISPAVTTALILTIGFVMQNQLLVAFSRVQKVKMLKIINPDGYSGTQLPLDTKRRKKWSIGNNPKNDIYIKWLDYDVRNDHCYIEYTKGKWTAYAYNGEIYKNGVLISNGTELELDDLLSLGPNGITQFKFDEIDQDSIDQIGYQNTSAYPTQATATVPDSKPVTAKADTRTRIKIRPRTT